MTQSNLSILQRLSNWYAEQCNGDWEHTWGIKIETLDNPGWEISIDLRETGLENAVFTPIHEPGLEREPSANFLFAKVEQGKFSAGCSTHRIEEVLAKFLDWAQANSP